jgi:hypothetical protein
MLTQNLNTGLPDGLFVAAYDLIRGNELPNYHRENLSELIDWFRKNLKRPSKFNSSSSKGADKRNTKGVSWYKDTSLEHIEKMREVTAILRDLGLSVNERATIRRATLYTKMIFKSLLNHTVRKIKPPNWSGIIS